MFSVAESGLVLPSKPSLRETVISSFLWEMGTRYAQNSVVWLLGLEPQRATL